MLKIISNTRHGADLYPEFPYKSIFHVDKVSKTRKGGKNMSFVVLAAAGNKKDTVGLGTGKARNVSAAMEKAMINAVKNAIVRDENDVFNINYKYCASKLIIRSKRNCITRAADYITTLCEAAGLHNISCKVVGSKNIRNNVYCFFNALKRIIKINKMINLRKEYLKKLNPNESN